MHSRSPLKAHLRPDLAGPRPSRYTLSLPRSPPMGPPSSGGSRASHARAPTRRPTSIPVELCCPSQPPVSPPRLGFVRGPDLCGHGRQPSSPCQAASRRPRLRPPLPCARDQHHLGPPSRPAHLISVFPQNVFSRSTKVGSAGSIKKIKGPLCKNAATVNPETQSVLYY